MKVVLVDVKYAFTFPKSSLALVCTALPDVFINYKQFHV